MATGYTADILDGKITTASEFAKECAHAFILDMRDELPGSDIVLKRRNIDYDKQHLREALDRLKAWDNSTEEDRYAEWSDYVLEKERRVKEIDEKAEENLRRLNKILDEVKAIEPPETHINFHKFMIEQIEGTIEFDGKASSDFFKTQPYETWVNRRRGYIIEDVDYYAKQIAKAEEIYQKSLEWVSTLARVYNVEISYE